MIDIIFGNRWILNICFLLLFIFLFIATHAKNSMYSKIMILSSIIFIIILSSFCNSEYAVDLDNYERIFNTIKNFSISKVIEMYGSTEIGFYLLNKLVSFFGDFTLLRLICSIIIYYHLYKIIKIENNRKFFLVGIITYLSIQFFNSFNILRQSISVILFVYAYSKFIKEEKLLHYVVYMLVAYSFHVSAIAAFIVGYIYFYIYKLRSNYLKAILVVISLSISLFFEQISSTIFGSISILEKYNMYISINNSTLNLIFYLDVLVLLMYIVICRCNKISINNIHIYLLILCCCTQALGFYGVYLKRIAMYFETLQIITFIDLRSKIENQNFFVVYVYLIIRFMLFSLIF